MIDFKIFVNQTAPPLGEDLCKQDKHSKVFQSGGLTKLIKCLFVIVPLKCESASRGFNHGEGSKSTAEFC